MTPRVKYGLIVGAVGLIINICVSAFIGLCGVLTFIIVGAVAGYLTANEEKAATRSDGLRAGAIAGLIAAGLVFVGQLIGGVGALLYYQSTGAPTLFGELPQTGDAAGQIGFWVGGLGFGFCAGLFGAVLSALAGAGTGYLATSE
jgi:LPXTG-motif cell wall-anchored protein